mmetsp:Transcript_27110/g.62324  ORF Transcript_27110/g.62324 Transcript_27110/m.62324 type:complete len:340 (-) Transcript_27110:85-1104(-)
MTILPQPPSCKSQYTYITDENYLRFIQYQDTECIDHKAIGNVVCTSNRRLRRLQNHTLVWVLKSKGKKSPELFLRARVIHDNDAIEEEGKRRVLVRYPKGSTYHVRRDMLIPVTESGEKLHGNGRRFVIVCRETPQYRRACCVNILPDETFLEVGCAFGNTVDRVRRCLGGDDEGGGAAGGGESNDSASHTAIGVDKSEESIGIARSRYPLSLFSEEDALSPEGWDKIRKLCHKALKGGTRDTGYLRNDTEYHISENQKSSEKDIPQHKQKNGPDLVAIDINGTRKLPAVLRCLECMFDTCQENEESYDLTWKLPRLVIVKARSLHSNLIMGIENFPND